MILEDGLLKLIGKLQTILWAESNGFQHDDFFIFQYSSNIDNYIEIRDKHTNHLIFSVKYTLAYDVFTEEPLIRKPSIDHIRNDIDYQPFFEKFNALYNSAVDFNNAYTRVKELDDKKKEEFQKDFIAKILKDYGDC